MEKIVQRLADLGAEIESAKTERSELVGTEKQHLSQLKAKFGVQELELGKKKRESLSKEMEDLKGKILRDFEKLEEDYEW